MQKANAFSCELKNHQFSGRVMIRLKRSPQNSKSRVTLKLEFCNLNGKKARSMTERQFMKLQANILPKESSFASAGPPVRTAKGKTRMRKPIEQGLREREKGAFLSSTS